MPNINTFTIDNISYRSVILEFKGQEQCNTFWCWAAVASSVADFYKVSKEHSQCIIASSILKNDCCVENELCDCPEGIGAAFEYTGTIHALINTQLDLNTSLKYLEQDFLIPIRSNLGNDTFHFRTIFGVIYEINNINNINYKVHDSFSNKIETISQITLNLTLTHFYLKCNYQKQNMLEEIHSTITKYRPFLHEIFIELDNKKTLNIELKSKIPILTLDLSQITDSLSLPSIDTALNFLVFEYIDYKPRILYIFDKNTNLINASITSLKYNTYLANLIENISNKLVGIIDIPSIYLKALWYIENNENIFLIFDGFTENNKSISFKIFTNILNKLKYNHKTTNNL